MGEPAPEQPEAEIQEEISPTEPAEIVDEYDANMAMPKSLSSSHQSHGQNISQTTVSQITSSIKMCTADAIVGESVLELAQDVSNTHVNIDEIEVERIMEVQ